LNHLDIYSIKPWDKDPQQ